MNRKFHIYNEDGTSFHNLILHKAVVESEVMSLGDKITGEVYYKDSTLAVTMKEYVEYKIDENDETEDSVKYVLVNPPTVVREGIVSDNSELKGMTKYSFVFYHPMYMLQNFPFSDVAVSDDERKYLSQDKKFAWIGKPQDYIDKLNKNLTETEWVVVKGARFPKGKDEEMSDVLSFDNNNIAEALKKAYDTWEVPFIVDTLHKGEYFDTDNIDYYSKGKRYAVVFGLPSNEIIDPHTNYGTIVQATEQMPIDIYYYPTAIVVPPNKKIIVESLTQGATPVILNSAHDGVIGTSNRTFSEYTNVYIGLYGHSGRVRYSFGDENNNNFVFRFGQGLGLKNNSRTPKNNKIITRIAGFGSETNIPYGYPQIPWYGDENWTDTKNNPNDPNSYPIYEGIVNGALVKLIHHPFVRKHLMPSIYSETVFNKVSPYLDGGGANPNYNPNIEIKDYYDAVRSSAYPYVNEINTAAPSYEIHEFEDIKPEFAGGNTEEIVNAYPINNDRTKAEKWDESIDKDGKNNQGYFEIVLPTLNFDIYACAAITQEMKINMRSGACLGCTFTVQVDWDAYRKSFYDENGKFSPYGNTRDYKTFPNSAKESIRLILQKDTETFGTILPSTFQQPKNGDRFVILGISLPQTYISDAERRLDEAMRSYMLENNVYYYEYPLKISEHFLATNPSIIPQLRPNNVFRFAYNDEELELFIKQISIQYGESVLPQYSITLTDNIEVVLNKIGQVAEDVEHVSSLISILRQDYTRNVWEELRKKLSKVEDDTSLGKISFASGLNIGQNGQYSISEKAEAVLKSLLIETIVADSIKTETIAGKSYTGAELLGDKGFANITDSEGYGHMITDYLTVRVKAIFAALEIRKVQYSSGNILLGGAGSHIVRVVPIGINGQTIDAYMNEDGYVHTRSEHKEYATDGSGNRLAIGGKLLAKTVKTDTATTYASLSDFYSAKVAAWRCYALADDGTTATMNDWKVGDQAQCRTFNVDAGFHEDVSNRYYWRLVVNTGRDTLEDGKLYTYVDLSNVLAIKKDSGTAFRPLYDEWLALHPDKSESDLATVFFIGYHDYASAVEGTTGHGLWPHTDSKGNETVYGNDLPSVDDDIAQIGSQLDDERRGIVEIVAVGDAPSINIYAGIGDYDLAGHRVIRQSPNGFVVNSSYFTIRSVGDPTATSPVTCFRGDYSATSSYGYYDVVYYLGSLWLCVSTAQITGQTPSDSSIYWTKFVSKGDKGADGGMWCLVSNLGQITLPNEDSRATLNDGSDFRSLTVTLKYDTKATNLLPGELLVVSDGFYVDVRLGSSLTPQQDNSYAIGSMIPVSTNHGGGNSTPNTGVSAVTVYVIPKEYYNDIYAYSGGYYWHNPKAVIALCEQLCKCKAVVPVVRVPAVETYSGSYSTAVGYAQSFDDFVTIGSGKMSFAQGDKVLVASPFIKGECNSYGYPYYDSSLVPSDGAMCYVYDANMEVSNDPYKKNGHLFVARDGEWKDLGMLRIIGNTPYSYMPLPTVVFREEWDDVEGRARKLLGTTQYVTPLVFDHEARADIYSVTVTDYYDTHGAGGTTTPTPLTSTPPFVVDYESATGRLKVTLRHRNVNGTDTLNGVPFVSGYCKITISWDRGEASVTIPLYVSVARLGSYEASIQNDVYKSIASKTMVSPLDGSVRDLFTMIEQTSERLLFIQEGLRKCGISLEDGRIDLMANQVNFTTYALEPSERKPYIKVGKGDNGAPFLIFMDADGTNELYNLGYMGLPQLVNNAVAQSWLQMELIQLNSGVPLLGKDFFDEENYLPDTWYRFNDGYTLDANRNKIWAHTASGGGSKYDAKVYDSNTLGGSDGTSPTGSLIPNGYYALLTSFTTNKAPRLITKTRTYDLYRATSSKLALRTKLTIQWSYPPTTPGGLNPLESKVVTISMDPSSAYVTINNNNDETSNFQLR